MKSITTEALRTQREPFIEWVISFLTDVHRAVSPPQDDTIEGVTRSVTPATCYSSFVPRDLPIGNSYRRRVLNPPEAKSR